MKRSAARPVARGFTLVEMLVVVGIIVILVGILTPMFLRAYQGSGSARVKMDLQTIAVALEAYKQDHGDYPRVTDYGDTSDQYRGARLLTRALIAHFNEPIDGADGPGFRTRRLQGQAQGRVYGPYLALDSFRMRIDPADPAIDVLDPDDPTQVPVLLDKLDNPILYFPARARKPDLNNNNDYVSSTSASLYNQADNSIASLNVMRLSLIEPNGQYKTTGPFILWSAGPDGILGPDPHYADPKNTTPDASDVPSLDDVFNFAD